MRGFVLTSALAAAVMIGGLTPSHDADAKAKEKKKYIVETIDDIAIIQLYNDSFDKLSLADKKVAYNLYRAALAGRDITYHQNNKYGLLIKHYLESIIKYAKGVDKTLMKQIDKYTKLFWINNGNYNGRTKAKFLPEFNSKDLELALDAVKAAGKSPIKGQSIGAAVKRIAKSMFDPDYFPLLTVKSPPKGKDIITASAVNYYGNVTLAEVEKLDEKYPTNSMITKIHGKVIERPYRAGRKGGKGKKKVNAGVYATQLEKVNMWMEKAMETASAAQKKTFEAFIDYTETAEQKAFDDYSIAWLQDDPEVDMIMGFIESYKDPRSIKCEWEGLIYQKDKKMTAMMQKVAKNAQYFEDNAPWDAAFKKKDIKVPVANAVEIIVGTGGSGPSVPLGVNLPNSQKLREQYGSKSILITNVMEAINQAYADKVIDEFAYEDDRDDAKKYGLEVLTAMVALHEVIGHGSGKATVPNDPSTYLKEYYSTLEEARAELMALFYLHDPKLVELGIISNKKAADVGFAAYARNDLTMLRRITSGNVIQDDHMRATHLIVQYLVAKGAIELVEDDDKHFYEVTDTEKMQKGIASLLKEIMRIKAEGDYAAAKKLVEKYGVEIDPDLRDEVKSRAKDIGMPSFFAFVMPELKPKFDKKAQIIDVEMVFPKDFEKQMLLFDNLGKK